MKHLIATILFTTFLISACDTPLGNLKSDKPGISNSAELPKVTYSKEPVQADTVRKAAWQQFKAQNGEKWQISWNKNTGLPDAIYLGKSKKAYRGSPEDAAQKFLADNATLFGIADINKLEHVKTKTHKGVRHVTFNQMVNGVPVYDAEYQVHIRSNGQVDMANGTYYPGLETSTSPSLSEVQATAVAESDLGLSVEVDLKTATELVIYRQKEQFKLAWKLVLFSENPLVDWMYIVDAQSGDILEKLSQTVPVTGDGDVYPTHPGISSVSNESLYRLGGGGDLNGTYVEVFNDDGSEAYSGSNSFQFGTSNTHFDEVNLYYHVDKFRHNFVEQIDDGSLGFTKIKAHAHAEHYLWGDANAWFSRSNKEIYFGDAASTSTYNNFAREDKVVYHEYGHAVIYDVESGITSSNDEEGAISEGLPDYWAGSYTGRSIIGDYIGSTRDMANSDIDSYSEYESQEPVPPHDGGEFFSAILWNLRSKINNSAADYLTYDALYRVSGSPDFMDFRNAMIAADDAAYSSANYPDIQNAFADFEIGTHTPPTVTVSGPSSIPKNSSGQFSATVNSDGDYSSGPYTYQWYYKELIDHTWTPTGSNSSSYTHYTGSSGGGFEVKVEVTYANSSPGSDVQFFTVN